MNLKNVPPHLLDAARAIQVAAKHYAIMPQDVLSVDRNCTASCRARYAVWTVLHKSKGWRLIDIASEFKMSSSGVGIGIQKGTMLIIDRNMKFFRCVEAVKERINA